MHSFKRIILILFILFLSVILLIGCNEQKTGKEEPTPTVAPTEVTANPTEEPTPEPTEVPKETIKPGTGEYAGGITSEKAIWAKVFSEDDPGEANVVASTVAVQFFATTTFDQLSMTFVTFQAPKDPPYHIYYYLFAWQGTYDDTILSEPIVEAKKENFNDWENVTLEFEPQQDGEYLLLAYNENGYSFIGVFNRDAEHKGQRAYKDDQLWEGKSLPLQIHYTKTPNNLYGPLSDPW